MVHVDSDVPNMTILPTAEKADYLGLLEPNATVKHCDVAIAMNAALLMCMQLRS